MVAPDVLSFIYVHPEITQPGGGGTGQSGDETNSDEHGIPERALNLRVGYEVHLDHLTVSLTVSNRSLVPVRAALRWNVAADYADIQEAQNNRREQKAAVSMSSKDAELTFTYGHATLPYTTRIEHGGEWRAEGTALERTIALSAGETRCIALRIVPTDPGLPADETHATRNAALAAWRAAFTRIESPTNSVFGEALQTNIRDFGSFPLMTGAADEWLALQAGMPLYPAFFGRDAITAGWQAAMVDQGQSLDAAMVRLGRLQSDRFDDWHDEQPGRIPYQVRSGPLARLNINPYAAYYADYASPLMFVIAVANLFAWTGDVGCVRRHWDVARRILDWAREHGDADRDGYLEYQTRSAKGTKNQGWKDSGDAIIYRDGTPVQPPIATCELQGYWYIAQELMALLSTVMNATSDARALRASAASLKQAFNRDWWVEEDRFFAVALDPDKRRVGGVTSNVGHCLATGIIDEEHLPVVVGRMFEPDLFSGWGIRTLSTDHAFYNPLSYHRGTVWAVEQATIIFGLRRFGFNARSLELTRALFDLSRLYPEYRIPECVGGEGRGDQPTPGAYPRTNTPQLWNATAFPLAMQSMLGLLPLAPIETLVIDPILPSWLTELRVTGLRVGAATVNIRFWRENDHSNWELLHKQGTLRIVRQPPPESDVSTYDRVAALMETMVH
jgi:glycogen debranching enzyme